MSDIIKLNKRDLSPFLQNLYSDIALNSKSINHCCKEGCSHCCYQSIEIFHIEQKIINQYIKAKIKGREYNIIKMNLEKWFDFFDDNTSSTEPLSADEVYQEFKYCVADSVAPLACPFLIKNKCSIYPARPLACRIHSVESNPEKCKQDRLRNSCESAKQMRDDIKNLIHSIFGLEFKLLPFAVADTFKIQRKFKCIEQVRYE